MADVRKRIIFRGRVQGVGFRYTCLNTLIRWPITLRSI